MATKSGRPQATIDWGVVGKLLEADCKTVDIAAQFGVSTSMLYKRCRADTGMTFSALSQEKRSSGDNLLRAKQYQTAMAGNVTMMIWLGKQRLGQADKQEVSGKDGGPIVHKIDLSTLTNDQLRRIAAGEDIASVIGTTGRG